MHELAKTLYRIRTIMTLLFTLLGVISAAAHYTCTSKIDCEHLGTCVEGACACFAGFTGPSCAQLDLAPADPATAILYPPPPALGVNGRAYAWGFTVVAPDDDNAGGLYHAVANVGCYDPHGPMVENTFLMHLTSTQPDRGFAPRGIVAAQSSFNPHLVRAPAGRTDRSYALYFRVNPPVQANYSGMCGGIANATTWAAIVEQGPYINTERLPAGVESLLVAWSPSMGPGGWQVQPVNITGDATCSRPKSNPSAVFLRSPGAGVALAYRYELHGGSEGINVAVGKTFRGPFASVLPCQYNLSHTWGEDPFIWQSRADGSLHILYHCMRFGHGLPNWPALHAFSPNADGTGTSPNWYTTTSPAKIGAYGTNLSWANGTWSGDAFDRRERPELMFDAASGAPRFFYSAVQETPASKSDGWGWSFSFVQPVRGGGA